MKIKIKIKCNIKQNNIVCRFEGWMDAQMFLLLHLISPYLGTSCAMLTYFTVGSIQIRLYKLRYYSMNGVYGWMEIKTWFKGQLLAVQNKFLPKRKNSVDLSCNWTDDETTE